MIGLDEETRRAIAQSIAGDNTDALLETAPAGDGPGAMLEGETQPTGGVPVPFTDEGPMVSRDEAAASLAAPSRRPLELGRQAEPLPGTIDPAARMAEGRSPPKATTPERGGSSFDFARGLAGFSGGAAGISAYDKAAQERKEGPIKLQMQQGELADKQAERATKLKDIREAMDPNSEASKSAQQSAAMLNQARAQILAGKNPALAKMFADAATGAKGKTRLQLANAEKNYAQIMGEFGKMVDSEARQKLAAEGMDLKRQGVAAQQDNAAATRALSRDQLSETTRHNKATEDGKITARIEQEQEKLNEKVAGLNEQDELMHMVGEQKKKVNTGILANATQQLLKKVGLESKEFDTLEGLVSGVNNQIIKLQAGGNVTAGEAVRMRQQLPSPDMDDQEFETKLSTVLNQIALKKKNASKQYQRAPTGAVKDAAPISKELVGKQEGGKEPGGNPPPAPAAGTPVGYKVRNKRTGEEWVWNGSQWGK